MSRSRAVRAAFNLCNQHQHRAFQEQTGLGPLRDALTRSTLGGSLFGSAVASHSQQLLSSVAASRAPGGIKALLNDYKQLSKFRLSSLVVLTSAAGYVAGSGSTIDWVGLGWTALGTFGAAACANTLNQIYEVVNDSKMSRTCNRPLPSGRRTRLHAAAFALAMGAAGLGILYDKTNVLTACLGASNIALYAGVYTPLKQLSVANTWVGALVGAIPPLMGWSAASGSLDAGSAVLAVGLFCWQMPHFLSLAWLCKDDYIRGGFQMLSRIDPQGRRTAMVALRHCAFLAPLGLLAYLAEVTTWPFAVEAAALAAALGAYSLRFSASPTQQTARKLFKISLLYLPVMMAAMAVHRLPNTHSVSWEELGARLVALVPWAPEHSPAAGSLQDGLAQGMEGLKGAVGSVASGVRCPSRVHCKDLDRPEEEAAGPEASVSAVSEEAQGPPR